MSQRFHHQKTFAARSHGLLVLMMFGCCVLSGCRIFARGGPDPNIPVVDNPLVVPLIDREQVMQQVSDEIDDYFRILREQRIRVVDGLISEGWIETHPQVGGTLLEPWRLDSTPGFERLHATLQTVRRFAKVRVIPSSNGYQVDVKVYKELEDQARAEGLGVRDRQLRNDFALDLDNVGDGIPEQTTTWIPLGRDFSLEQKILSNLQARLSGIVNESNDVTFGY